MKKVPDTKWVDFTIDTMVVVKKFVCGQDATPPVPTASSSPINVVDDKEDVVQPTQVTSMANVNVVPSTSSHNLSSYLAWKSCYTTTTLWRFPIPSNGLNGIPICPAIDEAGYECTSCR